MAAAKRPKKKADKCHKSTVGSRPGSSRAARLIPEFKTVRTLAIRDDEIRLIQQLQATNKGWIKEDLKLSGGSIPAVTRMLEESGKVSQGCAKEPVVHCGIPWAPEEFIEQAKAVRHPFGEPASVSDRHRYANFMYHTQSVEAIRRLRAKTLEYWKKESERAAGRVGGAIQEGVADGAAVLG